MASQSSNAAMTEYGRALSPRATFQAKSNTRLGRIVIESKLVSEENLERALQMQTETGERLGNLLVALELISEDDLVQVLAKHFGVPVAELDRPTCGPGSSR